MTPIETATKLFRAIESGACGDELRGHFAPHAVTVEHPNLIKPAGSEAALEQMLEASVQGARLLASQRYDVREAISHGGTAIIKLTWSGVLARDAGPFREGDELKAHIAQFVDTNDGLITRIETYDCYEPVRTAVRP